MLKIIPNGVSIVVEVGGNGTLPKYFASVVRSHHVYVYLQRLLTSPSLEAMGGMVAAIGFVAGSGKEPIPDANGLMLLFGGVYRGILVGSRAEFEEMVAHIEAIKLSETGGVSERRDQA